MCGWSQQHIAHEGSATLQWVKDAKLRLRQSFTSSLSSPICFRSSHQYPSQVPGNLPGSLKGLTTHSDSGSGVPLACTAVISDITSAALAVPMSAQTQNCHTSEFCASCTGDVAYCGRELGAWCSGVRFIRSPDCCFTERTSEFNLVGDFV